MLILSSGSEIQGEWRGNPLLLIEYKGEPVDNWLPINCQRGRDNLITELLEGSGKLSWCSKNQTNPHLFPLPLSLGESQSLGPYVEIEAFHLEDCLQKYQIRGWKQHCGTAQEQEPLRKSDNRIQDLARDWY